MENFNYYNPCHIYFGNDTETFLKHALENQGFHSLLMIYSGDFIKTLGIYQCVEKVCKELDIKFSENGSVVPNPHIELVKELVGQARKDNVDFILAVGGGSAIDTAKTVACSINYEGDPWDFFEGKALINSCLPVGVITTIPASGSETSNCAIITKGESKMGIEDNLIIPKFAIMNPSYTLTLPPYQTSCGIADIMSHLLERYFTNSEHVDTTDYLIEGAIKALTINAERIMHDPNDYNARAEIQWLASLAHNNLLDTGRIACWGSHRIEHEISGEYNITHGEGMAVVLIAYCKYMSKHHPEKLAQLANRVYNYDYHNYSKEEMALKLACELTKFFRSINLKTTLHELNIDDTRFKKMALRATNNGTSTVGHYVPLDADKIEEILRLAL